MAVFFITMVKMITAITPQKKNTRRVNIYLDGEFAFGLSNTVAAWLQVGQKLEDTRITDLVAKDAREVAFQRAMHFSSYRMRSESEIRKKLSDDDFDGDVITDVIARLKSLDVVNDLLFTQNWVENRVTFRPRSKRQMAFELHQKGISDELIDTALSESVDEEQLAYRLGTKYASRLKGMEREDFRKKLSAYLMRKGFSYEIVKGVVNQVWEEQSNSN